MELSRKESVERNDLAESLRSAIAALEKENSNLKVDILYLAVFSLTNTSCLNS